MYFVYIFNILENFGFRVRELGGIYGGDSKKKKYW